MHAAHIQHDVEFHSRRGATPVQRLLVPNWNGLAQVVRRPIP